MLRTMGTEGERLEQFADLQSARRQESDAKLRVVTLERDESKRAASYDLMRHEAHVSGLTREIRELKEERDGLRAKLADAARAQAAAVMAEREACAAIADAPAYSYVAIAIRSRAAPAEWSPPCDVCVAPTTLDLVAEEVKRARAKFPRNAHMLAALVEEVGEVARALLDGEGGHRVREEAIQVACVAVRIADEGDYDFVPDAAKGGG